MLLALDVGNTNTVLGLYDIEAAHGSLVADWRVTTHLTQTVDEYGMLFLNLFRMNALEATAVTNIIISSVVPPLETTLRRVCEKYFGKQPVFVGPGVKSGMPILVENPAELGADRLADCVAAFERYGGPTIVVDFGTATKFEAISEKGEYLGGAIAPGLGISADALFNRAAKLFRIDIKRPPKVIGTNTITHLQSGLYFGYIGLVDGILERIIGELGKPKAVVATGGLARMIAEDSRFITNIDDMLTLDGLRIIFERNRAARTRNTAH